MADREALSATRTRRTKARVAEKPAPVTERGRRSRERLVEAARQVFGKHGYHAASIIDIVQAAGIAQGTFYLYFESKQAIFAEVVRSLTEIVRARSREAIAGAEDALDAEQRQFRSTFKLILDHPEIYRIIEEAEFVDPDLSTDHYLGVTRGWAKRLAGELKPDAAGDTLDPETLVFCLFGIASFVGMRWAYWRGKPVPDDVIDSLMRFVRNGMAPYVETKARPRRK